MFPVDISTNAALALDSAAHWYENQQSGLGNSFIDDFEEAIQRIQKRPRMFPFFKPPLRKCLGRRFPFIILYEFDEIRRRIYITGAWHQKQQF